MTGLIEATLCHDPHTHGPSSYFLVPRGSEDYYNLPAEARSREKAERIAQAEGYQIIGFRDFTVS